MSGISPSASNSDAFHIEESAPSKDARITKYQRILQFCSATLKPTYDVFIEVTSYYSKVSYADEKIYACISGQRNQSRYYKFLISKATCYEQWAAAGYMLDRIEGRDDWKNKEKSSDYDHELLKDRLNILRTIRKNADIPAMIFNLRTSLSRNLGDMGNPKLYQMSCVGTKSLIEDYIDEVTKQLNFICDVDIPGYSIQDKLRFFRDTQKSFGRTALLLSGGGTFGLLHIGTMKVLWEQKLLPRIITGSSAGSIVAAILCTRTDKEFHSLMDPRDIDYNFFERNHEADNFISKFSRFFKTGVVFDIEAFNECMYNNVGDMTFAEAFNKTRRILNITVSSTTNFEMPKLLNYLTAPNVLIRSAVYYLLISVASSAVPFLFEPAPLLAKDAQKNIVLWNPSDNDWIDGSVEGDLPMQRISEFFGVNHYCVAQVNPHVMPFMSSSDGKVSIFGQLVGKVASVISGELQHRLQQLVEIGITHDLIFKIHAIISQKYAGDITIVPKISWIKYLSIISSPDDDMAREYTIAGIALLRNHILIEQCLNQNIMSLREQLIVENTIEGPITKIIFTPPSIVSTSYSKSRRHTLGDSDNPIFDESNFTSDQSQSSSYILNQYQLIKDDCSSSKLIRNHRSTGDVRKLNDIKNLESNATSINRTINETANSLIILDLTFEDSDDGNL